MTIIIRRSLKALWITCAITAVSISYAGPKHWEHRVAKLSQHLDLTSEQQIQVTDIVKSNQPKRESLRGEIKQLHQQLSSILDAINLDENRLGSVNATIAEKKTALMILRANTKNLIKEQLTNEQLTAFKSMQEKRKQRHADRKQRYLNN